MDAIEIERAKSIAHLFMLNPFSRQPRENPLPNAPDSEGYTLSFDDEMHLAIILAFLSSNSSNSEEVANVTAVCVKENSPESLDVLVAINKCRPDDGNSVLREVQERFVGLFNTLSQNASPCSTDYEDRVFDAILSMCHNRILFRLRTQTPIKVMLTRARQAIKADEKSLQFYRFLKKVGIVERAIDVWLTDKSCSNLKTLVEGFCDLQQLKEYLTHLKKDVRDTPEFPYDMKKCLLDTIKKIAWYRECIPFLCRLQSECPLFGQVNIVPVRLPTEAFSKTLVGHLEPNLESKILPTETPKGHIFNALKSMCRLLGKPPLKPISEANDNQVKEARKILAKGVIHAEIQLLFHCYELEYSDLPPRVVCSSKYACRLCNEFISFHGKMYTPKTHGKLYHVWRLPKVGNSGLHTGFTEHLDGLIREYVRRAERDPRHPRRESTVCSLPDPTLPLGPTSFGMTKLPEEDGY